MTFAQHRFVTESGCSVSTLLFAAFRDPNSLPSACLSVDRVGTMPQTTSEIGENLFEMLSSCNKSGDNQVALNK